MKRTFEIWTGKSGSAFFMQGAKRWRENLDPDFTLAQTFEAESTFEAFRTYNRLMGWGEWKPLDEAFNKYFTGDDQHDFS